MNYYYHHQRIIKEDMKKETKKIQIIIKQGKKKINHLFMIRLLFCLNL